MTVDALTGATLLEFGYDTAGRLVAVADGDGNSTEIERGADGRADAIVGPYGARTTLAVRADGWLGAVTDPEAGSHALDYAPGGLLTSFAGPDGHASTFTYEDDGRLRADHSPDGEAKTLARTDIPRGHEVTITTALGSTRSHTIELTDGGATRRRIVQPTGATTEQVRKEGSTTTTHADGTTFAVTQGGDPRWGTQAPVDTSSTLTTPGGLQANVTVKREALLQNASQPTSLINLKETVTANGQSTTGVFDVATRTSTLTSPLQRLVTIQHDAMGRPLSTSIAGLATATNTYDAHGRPSTTTQGDRTWTQSYDGAGNLAAVTGPESFRRDYAYDDAGRLLRTTLPDDREINFAYDAAGRLNSLTPPGRPQHGVVYSNGGKTKVYEPPASAEHTDVAEHYDYDLDGRLASVERPGGGTVEYDYDAAGQLTTVEADGETLAVGYQATGARKANRLTAPGGEEQTFGYDGSLLTSEQWTGPVAGEVGYEYDTNLRLAASTVNGGSRAELGYDADGLLTRAGDLTLTRRADNGALTSSTLGSTTTEQVQSAYGELSSLRFAHGANTLLDIDVERDDLGRIVSKTEQAGATAHAYGYTYDNRGRLTAVTRDGAAWRSYAYDGNGNRVEDVDAGSPAVTSAYDNQDRLTERGDTTYRYTPAGELKQRIAPSGTTQFEHDGFGALREVELPGGSTIEYVLDGHGRRVGKRVDGVLVQRFLYGYGHGPMAELNADGSVRTRFVYGSRQQVPDYMVRGGTRYRLVSDDLGSVRAVVEADTGAVVQELDYDPYGRTLRDTNPGFQPFGWAGGVRDTDTGLIRFGARDYDPDTGRWTSKDPIGFSGGDTNLYGYVLGDPVNLIDPTGLEYDLSWMGASEFAAGAFDSITFGLGSAAFGVKMCSDMYGLGGLFGDANPKGIAKRAVKTTLAAVESRAVKGASELDGAFTTIVRDADGRVKNYTTHRRADPRDPEEFRPHLRFDRDGKAHYNKETGEYVSTPHVHDPDIPGGVRPARPDEMPR